MCEHLKLLAVTGKKVKNDDDSAIQEQLFCNRQPHFEDLPILTTSNNDLKFTLTESLLMNRYHSPLNKENKCLLLDFLITKEKSLII